MYFESSSLLLQDILLLLGFKEKTGELVLESGNNIGTIVIHRGNIVQAFSPYSRSIGDILVEDGIITETELLETLDLQKRTGTSPIGGLLIKTGKVNFPVIETMVRKQITEAIGEFMDWRNLHATFAEKEVEPFDPICICVQELIPPEIFRNTAQFLSVTAARDGKAINRPPAASRKR